MSIGMCMCARGYVRVFVFAFCVYVCMYVCAHVCVWADFSDQQIFLFLKTAQDYSLGAEAPEKHPHLHIFIKAYRHMRTHLSSLDHLLQDLSICGHPSMAEHIHHGVSACKDVLVEPASIDVASDQSAEHMHTCTYIMAIIYAKMYAKMSW
jgi:hypothetical protein